MATTRFRMRFLSALIVVLAVVVSAPEAWATSPGSLYRDGKERLEAGKADMALLHFRELLRDYPNSPYAEDAHFLVASYYMQTRNFFEADRWLREHRSRYPESPHGEQVVAMLNELEVLGLEARGTKAMERSEYRIAKILWEDVLAKNPDHALAKRKLAECERMIERMDYEKRQLETQKRRIEDESKAIAKLLEEARRQREEAERIRTQAEQMDETTRAKYEAALGEANKLSLELEGRIRDLETDLKLWRDRARKYEARVLGEPDISPLEGIATAADLPKIIFEGPEADPFPEPDEQQVAGLVVAASPSVVLVGELMNRETNVLKAEVVAGVDLEQPWPKESTHLLKVRIDFHGPAGDDGTAPLLSSKTIYYTLADMDEVDTRNRAYRKKIIIAVDKNTVDTYSVAAYFVAKTKP
jgi:tetratricopeptide (TPR) repeat protein